MLSTQFALFSFVACFNYDNVGRNLNNISKVQSELTLPIGNKKPY